MAEIPSNEPVDWPLDLPGRLFVLRAVRRLMDRGTSQHDAERKIAEWHLAQEVRENGSVLQHSRTGRLWAHLPAHVWSTEGVRREIFDAGGYSSAYAPGEYRKDPISPFSWVQVHQNCVDEIIRRRTPRQGKRVSPPIEREFVRQCQEYLAKHKRIATRAQMFEWASELGVSQKEAENKLFPLVKRRERGETIKTIKMRARSTAAS